MRWRECLLIVCLLLFVVGCGCARRRVSKAEEIEGGQDSAAVVIDALEAYRREHGEYPEKLQMLLTDYLSHLPKTPAGVTYAYRRSDLEGGYRLCFDLTNNRRAICCYTPRLGSWGCGMKGE